MTLRWLPRRPTLDNLPTLLFATSIGGAAQMAAYWVLQQGAHVTTLRDLTASVVSVSLSNVLQQALSSGSTPPALPTPAPSSADGPIWQIAAFHGSDYGVGTFLYTLVPGASEGTSWIGEVAPVYCPDASLAYSWAHAQTPAPQLVLPPADEDPLAAAAQAIWLDHHQALAVLPLNVPQSAWYLAPIAAPNTEDFRWFAWQQRLTPTGTRFAVFDRRGMPNVYEPPALFDTREALTQALEAFAGTPHPIASHPLAPPALMETLRVGPQPDHPHLLRITRWAPHSSVLMASRPLPVPATVASPEDGRIDTQPEWYLHPVDPAHPQGPTIAWHLVPDAPDPQIVVAGSHLANHPWRLLRWGSLDQARHELARAGIWTQVHPTLALPPLDPYLRDIVLNPPPTSAGPEFPALRL